MTAAGPTTELGPTAAASTTAPHEMVAAAPTRDGAWMTARSCTAARSPMVTGPVSPRMTAPYQTEEEACSSTLPMTLADGARKTSEEMMGFESRRFMTWRWRETGEVGAVRWARVSWWDGAVGDWVTYVAR
ncbi:unnamed protein product [Chondrus crispus]|uniref:Uncharacterized protein n=1 Tax=Chondrus crispus TaxID=2769 RepID=R7Q6S8_CHOCR|nr:unnamed protein product [Chondrus crispus]CDF33508.1 unnamed protein product [Chondrus crispus]|eukprot:XP_005713312.1 unnamed protein product [Chondrus crispus]